MTAFVEGGTRPGLDSLLEGYTYAAPDQREDAARRPGQGADAGRPDEDHDGAVREPPVRQRELRRHAADGRDDHQRASSASRAARRRSSTSSKGFGRRAPAPTRIPRAIRAAKLALQQENYEVKPLLLPSVETIPDDASVGRHARRRPAAHRHRDRGARRLPEARRRTSSSWSARARATTKLATFLAKLGREARERHRPRPGGPALRGAAHRHAAAREGRTARTRSRRTCATTPSSRRRAPSIPTPPARRASRRRRSSRRAASSWGETDVDDVFTEGRRAARRRRQEGAARRSPSRSTAKLKRDGHHAAAAAEGQKAPDEARLVVIGTPRFADKPDVHAVAHERRPLPERGRLARRTGRAGLDPQPIACARRAPSSPPSQAGRSSSTSPSSSSRAAGRHRHRGLVAAEKRVSAASGSSSSPSSWRRSAATSTSTRSRRRRRRRRSEKLVGRRRTTPSRASSSSTPTARSRSRRATRAGGSTKPIDAPADEPVVKSLLQRDHRRRGAEEPRRRCRPIWRRSASTSRRPSSR